jgi:hypothetical protein
MPGLFHWRLALMQLFQLRYLRHYPFKSYSALSQEAICSIISRRSASSAVPSCNTSTLQLSPSGRTEIIISVGPSQISSNSTLIEASSSAAVLLGFFMMHIPPRDGRIDSDTRSGTIPSRPGSNRSFKMIRKVIGAAFLAAAIFAPLSAPAQGVPGGVEKGAREGERAAGPVSAIVGGTIGGVVGGVTGILGTRAWTH